MRVLRQGCWPAAIGVTLGLALAVPAGRAIRSQLFQVQPADPLVLAIAAAIIVCAALIASVAPAVRASRVDPVTALRQDGPGQVLNPRFCPGDSRPDPK